MKKTLRGFSYKDFIDKYGAKCSIQESSSIEPSIWFGANDINLKGFTPYGKPESWRDITNEEIKEKFGVTDIVGTNRMHLTRSMVKKLLPYLQCFVDTGSLEEYYKKCLTPCCRRKLKDHRMSTLVHLAECSKCGKTYTWIKEDPFENYH